MTGRTREKLDAFVEELVREGFDRGRHAAAAGDCGRPGGVPADRRHRRRAFRRLDVLVNNAGAAGPKRTLRRIPFTNAEKRALGEDQTMLESAMNLLGAPWHMVRASVPHMATGGSIVNISTIFSRTPLFRPHRLLGAEVRPERALARPRP